MAEHIHECAVCGTPIQTDEPYGNGIRDDRIVRRDFFEDHKEEILANWKTEVDDSDYYKEG